MLPQAPHPLAGRISRRARNQSPTARIRTGLPFGVVLVLSALVASLSACTTEVITAVPPDAAEGPGAGDDPDADDDWESDDDDDDRDSDDDRDDDDRDVDDSRAVGEEVFGIPEGHMPSPGGCRIWDPGLAPGRQSPPGSCAELRPRLPSGSWLLFRPNEEPRVFRIA